MDASGASGGKLFGHFTEPAHQVLDLAWAEAARAGHRAGLAVDLGRLQEAVAAERRGSQR